MSAILQPMENAALKSAYEKLLALPEDKQEEAARLIEDFVANDDDGSGANGLRLTPEQIEEVKRRLADPHPVYVPDDEMEAFFDRLTNEG